MGRVERLTSVQPVDIGIFRSQAFIFSRFMLQLAIECSAIHGSVAVCDSRPCVESIQLPTDKSSVQTLAQTVKSVLAGRRPDFISVTSGPGSFTGLRVGLTTVKMLGLAWNLPIVAVDTLQVLAHQIAAHQTVHRQSAQGPFIVVPVINAFRRQVFTSVWLAETNGTIVPLTPACVLDADQWLANPVASAVADPARVQKVSESFVADPARVQHAQTEPNATVHAGLPNLILIGGPGLDNYSPNLSHCQYPSHAAVEQLVPVEILPGILPDAKWVADVGFQRFNAGYCESAESLLANYVRASAAEEKLRS